MRRLRSPSPGMKLQKITTKEDGRFERTRKPQIDFMHKLARQIVERRNLVFLFVILAAIFTVFSVRWVKVETDMTTYLP